MQHTTYNIFHATHSMRHITCMQPMTCNTWHASHDINQQYMQYNKINITCNIRHATHGIKQVKLLQTHDMKHIKYNTWHPTQDWIDMTYDQLHAKYDNQCRTTPDTQHKTCHKRPSKHDEYIKGPTTEGRKEACLAAGHVCRPKRSFSLQFFL